MAFQAFDREFNPVNTSQASLMAGSDLGNAHGNPALAESQSAGLRTKSTSIAQNLDCFKEKFYQWYFVDKYQLKVVKEKFDILFKIIRDMGGQSFQAEVKDWRNCLRSWNTHWSLKKNNADEAPYPANLDHRRVFYKGHQPLFDHLPSLDNVDKWPTAATGPPTVPLSQPSIRSHTYDNSGDHARNELTEHDFAGDAEPQHAQPLTGYATEFNIPFSGYANRPHISSPVAESTNIFSRNPYREADDFSSRLLGHGLGPTNQDILRRTSASNASKATEQYATTSTPDNPQPRSHSLPENFQTPESFLSCDQDPLWHHSNTGGTDEPDWFSRKFRPQSFFLGTPPVRVRSGPPHISSSDNRPLRCATDVQPTPDDTTNRMLKDFNHTSVPNQNWQDRTLSGLAEPCTYTYQPNISSSIPTSTLNPSSITQATIQETYHGNEDYDLFEL